MNIDGKRTVEEHTGEARLGVEAPTLAALFEQAARGLADLMGAGGAQLEGGTERIELEAPDRDALLVQFLNELIFFAETRQCVYPDVKVEHVDSKHLVAVARGKVPPELRTLVKAA